MSVQRSDQGAIDYVDFTNCQSFCMMKNIDLASIVYRTSPRTSMFITSCKLYQTGTNFVVISCRASVACYRDGRMICLETPTPQALLQRWDQSKNCLNTPISQILPRFWDKGEILASIHLYLQILLQTWDHCEGLAPLHHYLGYMYNTGSISFRTQCTIE